MPRRTSPSVRVSMRDVAERAGVSPMTVSYVLRGRTDLFRPETCERVQRAIAALGYVPSRSPRAMRTGRFGAIAFVASLATATDVSWYAQSMLDAIVSAASTHDLDLIYTRLVGTDGQPKLLRDANVDGLIINAIAHVDAEVIARLAQRYPLVYANSGSDKDSVRPDEGAAGGLAAEQLLAAGCRRLGYVQFWPDSGHFSFPDRRRGFLAVAKQAGREVAVMPIPKALSDDDHLRTAKEFIAQERPDGVCCFGQREALAITEGAHAEGVTPHGIATHLVAFGETVCHIGIRSIPTIIIPYAHVGRQALAMLLDKIERPGPRPAEVVPVVEVRGGQRP